MALSTQPYKGARDFYPEEKRIQKFMFNTMRKIVERYGYEEYDAPILEPVELYLAKTGEEIVTEQTYLLTDRGERRIVIRPEMTPTVSRMVAGKRQELAYPLRWYSIPNLWRYERPQRGRLREHWQLNVDMFGVAGIEAEHELIQLADAILHDGFKARRNMYTIKVNSRMLMSALLHEYLELDSVQAYTIAKLIDRKNKLEKPEFITQAEAVFTPTQRERGLVAKFLQIMDVKDLAELPDDLRIKLHKDKLSDLLNYLRHAGISNIEFDITVMRGFDYYTDIVFEVFDTDPENNRSMFGGGRYDGLVGLFGVEPTPTIGFGVGDVTLQNFLETHKLLPSLQSETDVYVVLIGDVYLKAQPILKDLRKLGVSVAVDITGRKADKQLKTSVKKGIHFALFIGENELDSEQFVLKNLHTGVEEKHGIQRIVSIVKDYRQK